MNHDRLWDVRLFRSVGFLMCVTGAIAFTLYPLHLFLGANPLAERCPLSYYLAATCGAVAIAWGIALCHQAGTSVGRKMLAAPSAIGFLLVALIRLFTIPYGTQVFHVFPSDSLNTIVPSIEVAVFGGLSFGFGEREAEPSRRLPQQQQPADEGEGPWWSSLPATWLRPRFHAPLAGPFR